MTDSFHDFTQAIEKGDLQKLIRLLDANPDWINVADAWKNTPLHVAAEYCEKIEIFEYLLAQGCSLSTQNLENETPLHLAAANRWKRMAYDSEMESHSQQMLGGREKQYHGIHFRWRVFLQSLWIGFHGLDKAITYLHSKWKNDRRVPQSNDPRFSNIPVIRFLLDHGADINAGTTCGSTPLHYAVEDNPCDLDIAFLIERGADVNRQGFQGCTPLHEIAQNDLIHVKMLLDAGADPTIKNDQGQTARDLLESQKKYFWSGYLDRAFQYQILHRLLRKAENDFC